MTIDVVLIGCGAMTAEVLARLPADEARVTAVIVRPSGVAKARGILPKDIEILTSVDDLTAEPSVIAECAGHEAVAQHGEAVLRRNIDLIVASVGALADRPLHDTLVRAAKDGGGRLILPAGAVAGIDALTAARAGGLSKVRYSSRKPPKSWKNTPAEKIADLDRVSAPTILYSGAADEAARLYPQNANVAATIALAGVGFDATEVQLIADPDAAGNIHNIHAEGTFGAFDIEMRGKPLASNPKTSMLAALSVIRAIRNRDAAVVI